MLYFDRIEVSEGIEGSDYCCIISLFSKNEAINLMQNADLTKKEKHYKA